MKPKGKKKHWCPNGCGKKVQWIKRWPIKYGKYELLYKCLSCNELLDKVENNVFCKTKKYC